ncbi:hypothetical protein, partial [Virgisporangium aliadipatigenens]|uniref:hypothetical protein n=1 Tax=Virgisporangium aliadipatigenens TaxID=741659 RepID=UPI0019442EBF
MVDNPQLTRQTTPDGWVIEYDGQQLFRQTSPEGTVLFNFDEQNRAHSGVTADHVRFTLEYPRDGVVRHRYSDGSSVTYDGNQLVQQTARDGTSYGDFDADQRPHSGVTGDGERFTLDYLADDIVRQRFADGSAVETRGDQVVRQTTADGAVYTDFDAQNRPHRGM